MPDVTMPQLGETVTEGTITKWYKAVGDQVARDEPLFEVSTDKVDSEVPSPAEGVLTAILVEEGDTVDVGCHAGGDRRRSAARTAPRPPTPRDSTSVGRRNRCRSRHRHRRSPPVDPAGESDVVAPAGADIVETDVPPDAPAPAPVLAAARRRVRRGRH